MLVRSATGLFLAGAGGAPGSLTKDGAPQFSTFQVLSAGGQTDHTHVFGAGCNAFTIIFGGEMGVVPGITSVVIDPAGANISCSLIAATNGEIARIWSYEAHGFSGLSGSKTIRITWSGGDVRHGRIQTQSYVGAANASPTPSAINNAAASPGVTSIGVSVAPINPDGILQYGMTTGASSGGVTPSGYTETGEHIDATGNGFMCEYGEKVGSLSATESPSASWTGANRAACVAFVVNPAGSESSPGTTWAYPLPTEFTDHGQILTGSGWDAAIWNISGNILVEVGGTMHLYYEGGDVWVVEHAEHNKLGVLTSTDGVSWTDYVNNPIAEFQPLGNGGVNPDEEGYWHHGVHRRTNGEWTCVFGGQLGNSATTVEIDLYMQTSNNGLDWTPDTATGRIKIVDKDDSSFAGFGTAGDELGANGLWYHESGGLFHMIYMTKNISGAKYNTYHVQGANLASLSGANSNLIMHIDNNPFFAGGSMRAGAILDRGNGVIDILSLCTNDPTTDEANADETAAALVRIPILPDYSWTAPGPPEIVYYMVDDFALSGTIRGTVGFFSAVSKALMPYKTGGTALSAQVLRMKTAPAVKTSDGLLAYFPLSARFTASGSQSLTKASGLTGQASSGKATFAFAIRLAAATPIATAGVVFRVEVTSSFRFHCQVNTNGTIQVLARNSSASTILDMTTTAGVNNNKWYTVVASIDMANYANCHFYIDRVSRKPASANIFVASSTIDFAGVNSCRVGNQPGASPQYLDAEISDLGFVEGVAFNLSDTKVLNRFVTANNELQNPGIDGRRMFLRRALVFFSGNGANFPTNRGTGGGFTVNNGPLTNGASAPAGNSSSGYAQTVDGLPGGQPIAHWQLNEPSGTQITDRKAGSRHGTYSGTIGYGAAGLPANSGTAINFPGTGSGSIPHSAGLALPAFTLSFWIQPNSLRTDDLAGPFIAKNGAGDVDGDFLVYAPGTSPSAVRVRFWSGATPVDLDTPVDVLGSGIKRHVLVRADNTGFDLYVDGIYYGKDTGYLGAWSVNTAAIQLAISTGFTGVYDGVIDEIALYNRVLTEAEVLQLAQRTTPPIAIDDAAGVPESATTSINVLANDIFAGTPAIEIVSQPLGGDSVAVSGQSIDYTAGAVAADTARSFTYRVTDPNGQSNAATVAVTVLDSAAPPSGQANCFVISAADTVEVNDAASLVTAINAAPPGRQILVAPGTYPGGTRTLNFGGTEVNPVVVRTRDGRGTVTFTDPTWTINGSYGVILDCFFEGAAISINGATHPRISRCRFRNINRTAITIDAGTDIRLDHLDFSGWVSSTTVKRCISWSNPGLNNGATKRSLVDYCYFHDMTPAAGVNGCNILNCATGAAFDARGGIVIDHCLLRNITIPNEPEQLGVKSSEVTVRFCTFDNLGSHYFQQRQGGGLELRSCWFENSGGDPVHIFDDNYVGYRAPLIIGNRLVSGNMWCAGGSGPAVAGPDGVYHASINGRYIGNSFGTGRLRVGEIWGDAAGIDAQNNNLHLNTIDGGGAAHVLVAGNQVGTTFNVDGEAFVAAVKLAPADVGLAAADPLCPSGPQS